MSKYKYSKDHLTQEQYKKFFFDDDVYGFDAAIENLLNNKSLRKSFKIPFFLNDKKRNDFIFLLPLSQDSVVLDYGSGWGNTASTLSPYVKSVVAMDADDQRLRFSARNFSYMGKNNVLAVQGGTNLLLPFADATFDIVIFNGVLEWMPLTLKGHPYDVHRRVLAEVMRILKPGGAVQISIENRYGYQYIMGKRDFHCGGLKWVPFLPRWLANAYSQIMLRRPYRTWFHSYSQLHDLIETCGFVEDRIYSYFPDHVNFSIIFPLDDEAVLRRALKRLLRLPNLRRSEQFLFSWFKSRSSFRTFAQDFMVVAYKPLRH